MAGSPLSDLSFRPVHARQRRRARRFYEREGRRPHRGPFDDEALGMRVVEYRREL